MDKQNAILKTHELEVIGSGGMVDSPCQIGEWWVMPVEQYKGTIPPEIMQKWDNFKALNIPVLGYLIADDMRDIQLKHEKDDKARRERLEARERAQTAERQARERQQRKEAFKQTAHEALVRIGKTAKVAAKEGGKGLVVVGKVACEAAVVAGKVLVAVGKVAVPLLIAATAVAATVIVAALSATASVATTAIMFDPILIAVLPDGRWVCLGAWWD